MPHRAPPSGAVKWYFRPRQDRMLASDPEERILLDNYYLPGDLNGWPAPSSSTKITCAIMRASTI